MSYDLMVFEPSAAPRNRDAFMEWFKEQAEWSEDHDYDDHAVTSPALQSWYKDIIQKYPPMAGPLANYDDVDNPRATDYSIGRNVIYSAFSWSESGEAFTDMRELAIKHSVGFFDASAVEGEILFPGDAVGEVISIKKPWWKFW